MPLVMLVQLSSAACLCNALHAHPLHRLAVNSQYIHKVSDDAIVERHLLLLAYMVPAMPVMLQR